MGSFFVSPHDLTTIQNPTRSKRKNSTQPTAEQEAWPEEAQIAQLMTFGFTYSEAFHMAPRDFRRYAGIFSSWAVSSDAREDGVRAATPEDAASIF